MSKCSGQASGEGSVAPRELSSGTELPPTEARRGNSTNLEQGSAEESTEQVLMGESRKQSLVLRARGNGTSLVRKMAAPRISGDPSR